MQQKQPNEPSIDIEQSNPEIPSPRLVQLAVERDLGQHGGLDSAEIEAAPWF